MEKRHFRYRCDGFSLPPPDCNSGGRGQWRAGRPNSELDLRARGRDLTADWRRWSYAERLSALTGGAALALLPVLAWSGVLIR
jgi:hypothetical protein